jgi:L-ribulose-5-phosphate 3-epimerase
MQGRLSPPVGEKVQCFPSATWQEEFARARDAGLACIEWIYDAGSEADNPLTTDTGIVRMRELASRTGVDVWSICADWFMTHRLVKQGRIDDAAAEHLRWLIGRGAALEAKYLVLPFVDTSSLKSQSDVALLADLMRRMAPTAERAGVELHLETDLPPNQFGDLLESIDHVAVRANYDTGNSASLGYQPADELSTLGPWLGSVHIKDRVRGGSTVPLGTGSADLPTCFRMFRDIGFDRWYILQVARGQPGEEVQWAAQNREYVERQLAAVGATV